MADINVERKERGIWPWLLGLLVLAFVIWLVMSMMRDDGTTRDSSPAFEEPAAAPVAPAPAPEPAAAPAPVTSFLDDCTSPSADSGPDAQNEFTARCLEHFADALSALADRDRISNEEITRQMGVLREEIATLRRGDPAATSLTESTRRAFLVAAALMESVRNAAYADAANLESEVAEVLRVAEGVRRDVPMLEQRDAVQEFFREAGDAIRTMAGTRMV